MDSIQLKKLFRNITVWKKGQQRAPHKPLLLLYALANLSRGGGARLPYSLVDKDLRSLLIQFGPTRKSDHPEFPFWRLQNDGLWTLYGAKKVKLRKGSTDAPRTQLLKYDVHGGFRKEVKEALSANAGLVKEIAADILQAHFPSSMHDDILTAVGLDISGSASKTKRDPAFRDNVLTAYEYRCAVCGFDVRIGNQTLGLEAAHVKWHQAGGPDTVNNGLALCTLHHKALDYGAFTISTEHRVLVSEKAHGSRGFDEWLMEYHGHPVAEPVNQAYVVDAPYLEWHKREVFKGEERPL